MTVQRTSAKERRLAANRAQFRFYEELNDFLPPERRKRPTVYEFEMSPSIKDAVEAQGVPHTEVDLILVNAESVPFAYRLKDNDRVAVYPVFESLDISNVTRLRERPLREPRFVLDAHLGKLARRLRLFGFDALYEIDFADDEIITLSIDEGRIILTRDLGILKTAVVTRGYWVRSQVPDDQLTEVMSRFELVAAAKPFARCLRCNGLLGPADPEKLVGRIPRKTREAFASFSTCAGCGRVYWKGSHYEKLLALVNRYSTKTE